MPASQHTSPKSDIQIAQEAKKRPIMELARERGVVQGRKMRVDTTVVETNVHYPTDSSLLGDGARVLTRTMKKVEKAAGGLKKRIRNRMRSVNKKVIAIALAGRLKGPEGEQRRVQLLYTRGRSRPVSSGYWSGKVRPNIEDNESACECYMGRRGDRAIQPYWPFFLRQGKQRGGSG